MPGLPPVPFIPSPALWFPACGAAPSSPQAAVAGNLAKSCHGRPHRSRCLPAMARTGGCPDGAPTGSEAAKGSGDGQASWPEALVATKANDTGALLALRATGLEQQRAVPLEQPAPPSPAPPGRSDLSACTRSGSHVYGSGSQNRRGQAPSSRCIQVLGGWWSGLRVGAELD